MSDIVERLREAQDGYQDDFRWAFELMSDAADEIEQLKADNERLRAAIAKVEGK